MYYVHNQEQLFRIKDDVCQLCTVQLQIVHKMSSFKDIVLYFNTPVYVHTLYSVQCSRVLYRGKVVIGFRLDPHRDVIRSLSNPS